MAVYDLTSTTPSTIRAGDILNCPYSGSYKTLSLPAGKYKLEVWGAQGGYRSSSTYGGKGGYSVGFLTLTATTTLYLYAGGAGGNSSTVTSSVVAGGFNGGGYRYGYKGGGGGSDIRIGSTSLYARVIVAGGGGSDGGSDRRGGYGGGTTGGDYSSGWTANSSYCGKGGTQTYSGYSADYTITSQTTSGLTSNTTANYCGGFGFGGGGVYLSSGYGGAGGGGWYGGSGTVPDSSADDDRGGGGGSGYIYTSSTASNYPSGCLLNSSYYLTDASMISGSASMPSPTATNSTETGHSGNGHVRITVHPQTEEVEEKTYNAYTKIQSVWRGIKRMYIKLPSQLPSGYKQLDYLQSTGTQWIDSGLTVTEDTWIDTELSFSASYAYNMMIGSWSSFTLSIKENNSGCIAVGGIAKQPYLTFELDKKYRIILGPNYGISVNGEYNNIGNSTNLTGTTNHLLLFGCNDANNGNNPYNWGGSNGYSQGKIYSCKFYTGVTNDPGASTLVRNFIPAKRISDNVLGMYDLVSNTFFTNSGNGTFTAGSEIDGTWTSFSINSYEKSWSQSNITTGTFWGLYYANNLWVASGKSAGLFFSPNNGETWIRSNHMSGDYSYIYYDNNLWIASSSKGYGVYYSTDGQNWTCSNFSTSNGFSNPYYGNNIWVIGNYKDNLGLYYSTDGKTWTQSNITSGYFTYVYYSNNIWVAGTQTAGLYYSTDGKTWTQSNITNDFINDILYVSTLSTWVANGDAGVYYSSNGTTWSSTVLGYVSQTPGHSLVYAQDKIVLGNKGGLWYSTNGVNWTWSNITSGNYCHIWYGNNTWMAAEAGTGNGIVTSLDGKIWNKDLTSKTWNNIYYGNGKWVAASNTDTGLWYKED